MDEHKKKVLVMLSKGEITVEEAVKLLDSLSSSKPKEELRFFSIFVDSEEEGGTRVRIKVPLRLIKTGMQLASLIPEASREKTEEALRSKGFDLRVLSSLKPEELIHTLGELEVSVYDSEKKETVSIFCE